MMDNSREVWNCLASVATVHNHARTTGNARDVPFIVPFTAGADKIRYVHRTHEVWRFFCCDCGGRLFNTVWNDAMQLHLSGSFPTLFESLPFR